MITPAAFLGFHAGARRRSESAVATGYEATIMALNPLAYFRFDEASGAANVASKVGGYTAALPASWSAGGYGSVHDGSGKSARSSGSAGLQLGSSLASTMLNSATGWTVVLHFNLSSPSAIFEATVNSTRKVGIGVFSNQICASVVSGGSTVSKSRANFNAKGGWRQAILTSSGRLWFDGLECTSTVGWSVNNTAGASVGSQTNATGYLSTGSFGELAIFASVLSDAQVNSVWHAFADRTITAGRTFHWTMEADTPDVFPPGAPSVPDYYGGAVRSTAQAHGGSYSLDCYGAWRVANFWNYRPFPMWLKKEEGTVRLWFRYTGTLTTDALLLQFSGKDQTLVDDTDDGISVRLRANDVLLSYGGANGLAETSIAAPIVATPDAWHFMEAKWKIGGTPTLSITVDAVTATSNTALTAMACASIHHVQFGSDLVNPPASGLWIDDVELFGSWQT